MAVTNSVLQEQIWKSFKGGNVILYNKKSKHKSKNILEIVSYKNCTFSVWIKKKQRLCVSIIILFLNNFFLSFFSYNRYKDAIVYSKK